MKGWGGRLLCVAEAEIRRITGVAVQRAGGGDGGGNCRGREQRPWTIFKGPVKGKHLHVPGTF